MFFFGTIFTTKREHASSSRYLVQGRPSYSAHQDHTHDGDIWKIKTHLVFIVNAHLIIRVKRGSPLRSREQRQGFM